MGTDYDQCFGEGVLPEGLRKLIVDVRFEKKLEHCVIPKLVGVAIMGK